MKRTKLVCVVYVKLTDKYSLSLSRSFALDFTANQPQSFFCGLHIAQHMKNIIYINYIQNQEQEWVSESETKIQNVKKAP